MAYLVAPAALCFYLLQNQQQAECEASRQDRIRGNYENKIRFYAAPEKMFEVFAGQKMEDGNFEMSFADFLHALTPY